MKNYRPDDIDERLYEIGVSLKGRRRCKAECVTCGGTGKEHYRDTTHFTDETRRCLACHGTGYVEALTDEGGNLIKCVTCGGTGKEHYRDTTHFTDETRRCLACHGTGYA